MPVTHDQPDPLESSILRFRRDLSEDAYLCLQLHVVRHWREHSSGSVVDGMGAVGAVLDDVWGLIEDPDTPAATVREFIDWSLEQYARRGDAPEVRFRIGPAESIEEQRSRSAAAVQVLDDLFSEGAKRERDASRNRNRS